MALTLAVAVAAGSLLDARVMSFAGRVRDFVRVTFPAGDPVWSLGKLGTWDPHALWREESLSNGACSKF